MAGHSTERDEKGRRLHGMKHSVSPEMLAELQKNVRCNPESSASLAPNCSWASIR